MSGEKGVTNGVNKNIEKRLSKLLNDKTIPVLRIKDNKYVIISDCHLGNGKNADNFHKNENSFLAALNYYLKNNYILILLGDIEEFWQFTLDEIINRYDKTVYSVLRKFQEDSTKTRLYRVYGNHDIDWKYPKDPILSSKKIGGALEALKMNPDGDDNAKINILLVHGHQGTNDSDKNLPVSRFFVKIYRTIEPVAKVIGIGLNPSLPQSEIIKDYEKKYYNWAKDNKLIVICAHTHRAIFASVSYVNKMEKEILRLRSEMKSNKSNKNIIEENSKKIEELGKKILEETLKRGTINISDDDKVLPCYFNCGCTIYREGITAIEIESDMIRLIKWNSDGQREDPPYGINNLLEYIKEVS